MKKSHIIIWGLLFVFAISIAIYTKFNYKNNNTPIVSPEIFNEENVIVGSYETKSLDQKDNYMTFDVKYPHFKNADDNFNLSIENFLKDQMENDRKISAENWKARYDTQIKGDNISLIPSLDDKFSFYSDFFIIQSNSSYISFVLVYGAFTGGAHGYENRISFNYDIKNKKILTLKDIFNNSNYLKYLSDESRKILKEQYATVNEEDRKGFSNEDDIKAYEEGIMENIISGTEPKEENFSVFTFKKDKVKIYFSQYQVGPYVMGMPEIEIGIR